MPRSRPTNDSADTQQEARDNQRLRMKAIGLSVAVSITLLGLKFFTYFMTHSSAVLSDALESIINVVASLFASLSIWVAAKPPDPDHPYGHGKIEYFSAGFEGAMIIVAAVGIFYSGVQHLLDPHPLPHLEQGVLILLGATAINLLLGLYLVHAGKQTESLTLVADGKHILTDVYSSVAVVIGLGLVYLTGWLPLDGIIACLVGINILFAGGKLVRQSYSRLMDASDPELLERISSLLTRRRRIDWVDIHQLRAWRAGIMVHIDLHLVLPEDISLEKAHQEADQLEKWLIEEFGGNASVLVHMDPCAPEECPICKRHMCELRHGEIDESKGWSREHLVRSSAGISSE